MTGEVLQTDKKDRTDQIWKQALTIATERNFVAASVIAAFLIRIFLVPYQTVINSDGAYYAVLGKRIVSGDLSGGISAYWSPLYSFCVGISSLFFQDPEFAGRFVSVVASSLLVVPSFYLIRDLFGRKQACIAAVLIVFHHFLIESAVWIMTEALYSLIFITAVWTIWRALITGVAQTFLIAGLLLGAAYLTKPEAIGFVGLLFALTIVAGILNHKIHYRKYVIGYLISVLGFAVLFVPYTTFLYKKTGSFTISQKIQVNLAVAGGYETGEGFLELSDDKQNTSKDRIWGDKYDTVNTSKTEVPAAGTAIDDDAERHFFLDEFSFHMRKQIREHIPALLPYPFILLILASFFCRPWTRLRFIREAYLFMFFFCTLVGYAATVVEIRYLFPLVPIMLGWAASGVIEVGVWASRSLENILRLKKFVNPTFIQGITAVLMVFLLLPNILDLTGKRGLTEVSYEEKNAGLWIRNNSEKTPLILSSNRSVAFYAQGEHLYLPDEEFPVIVEYAKRKNVDFIVYSRRRFDDAPRAFSAGEEMMSQNLTLVYKDEPHPDYQVLIYKVPK